MSRPSTRIRSSILQDEEVSQLPPGLPQNRLGPLAAALHRSCLQRAKRHVPVVAELVHESDTIESEVNVLDLVPPAIHN